MSHPDRPRDKLASAAQISYLEALGGTATAGLTKSEASELIDELTSNRPTARQMMVLRFWDRLDLSKSGVDGVSEWMNEFYEEDPDRREAWDNWKATNPAGDSRSWDDVKDVPIGAGEEYLKDIKKTEGKGCAWIFAAIILFVLIRYILW